LDDACKSKWAGVIRADRRAEIRSYIQRSRVHLPSRRDRSPSRILRRRSRAWLSTPHGLRQISGAGPDATRRTADIPLSQCSAA
jgi:hypothetical protein